MSDSLAELRERDGRRGARKPSETAETPGHAHAEHPVLRMQRQVGNAQVARMLAQRAGDDEALQMKRDTSLQRESEGAEEEGEALQMKRDTSLQRESEGAEEEGEDLQAKHDPSLQRESEGAEEEGEELQAKHDPALQRESEGAEEEDEAVQAKHDPTLQRESEGAEEEDEAVQAKHDPTLQRESEGAEEEDEAVQAKHDMAIQRKGVGLEGGELDGEMSSVIDSKIGGGSTLDDGVRRRAEETMGTSFSGVRVHQDAQSDALNRNMTAKAFTTGQDIFLRGDQNATDVSLMSHELTHVVQQRSMPGTGTQGKTVGAAGDSYEQQADAVAAQVVSGAAPQRTEDD